MDKRSSVIIEGRRAQESGVTLIEVMIVVAIMAMLAAGVAFAVLPRYHDAQIKTAKTSASTIRQAVQSWQMTNNETSCPSITDLVSSKQVDSANTKDPWGEEYAMTCTDDEVVVTSSGPDKKRGTKDDISVPEGAGTGAQSP